MADTPVEGETAKPAVEPENKVTTNVEAEELRKQLAQAQMRANQLENEAKKRTEKDEAERVKKLEEQNEFKELYEKTEAELKAIREKSESEARSAELAKASADVLKDYSETVRKIAETTGVGLTDDSEAGRKLLTDKLDAIKATLPAQDNTVTANNPYNPAAANPDMNDLVTKDKDGATPMAFAAASGNLEPTFKYIRGLSAIDEMKKAAGYKPVNS